MFGKCKDKVRRPRPRPGLMGLLFALIVAVALGVLGTVSGCVFGGQVTVNVGNRGTQRVDAPPLASGAASTQPAVSLTMNVANTDIDDGGTAASVMSNPLAPATEQAATSRPSEPEKP